MNNSRRFTSFDRWDRKSPAYRLRIRYYILRHIISLSFVDYTWYYNTRTPLETKYFNMCFDHWFKDYWLEYKEKNNTLPIDLDGVFEKIMGTRERRTN